MVTFGVHMIAKLPIPGWCNTRLASTIGQHRSAILQKTLIADQINLLRQTQTNYQLWLGKPDEKIYEQELLFHEPFFSQPTIIVSQNLETLLNRSLWHGWNHFQWKAAIFTGVDCILGVGKYLHKAKKSIEKNHIVLGPSIDGGVYLIGVPFEWKNPFENIPWETDQVFETLLKQAKKTKCPITVLKQEHDLDHKKDLQYLTKELQTHKSLAPQTAELLSTWE